MSDESIEAILRDAGVQREAGMRIRWAFDYPPERVVAEDEQDGPLPDSDHNATPDLEDPATYALCLAQLARRLKVGPEQGCVMHTSDYSDPPAWFVVGVRGVALVPAPREIDHRMALALALRATAPKGTSNG